MIISYVLYTKKTRLRNLSKVQNAAAFFKCLNCDASKVT